MVQLPLYPLWIIDIVGSFTMVILSILCFRQACRLRARDPENALFIYLMWLFAAILAFCLFRSVGHIIKHILLFSGHARVWKKLSPVSGSVNSITFIIIFAVTLFFRNMVTLMNHMVRDRRKIEQTSRQLFSLNEDMETLVSDRTRAELALRLAHEIRNPVVIIGGLIKRLIKGEDSEQRMLRYQETLLKQTGELEDIVTKFEELHANMQGRFKLLELNRLLRDSLEIVSHETESKGIRLNFTPSEKPLPIQGDQQYLKVALLHLLRNSIEACGNGSTITVSTYVDEQGVSLQIEDDGPGIAPEVLHHIFEPFYSTKMGATGLGLPYVRQIIQEHRGEITVASFLGSGTTATITLPSHLGELATR